MDVDAAPATELLSKARRVGDDHVADMEFLLVVRS